MTTLPGKLTTPPSNTKGVGGGPVRGR